MEYLEIIRLLKLQGYSSMYCDAVREEYVSIVEYLETSGDGLNTVYRIDLPMETYGKPVDRVGSGSPIRYFKTEDDIELVYLKGLCILFVRTIMLETDRLRADYVLTDYGDFSSIIYY